VPRKRKSNVSTPERQREETRDAEVRIIGGEFRGRRLRYYEDPGVRPMKHRTREAIFNLVSTECSGLHAIDLFAGSGALGLEALSRGAAIATLIERHVPTAKIIEDNIRLLGVEDRATLLITSAFLWAKRDLSNLDAARRRGDAVTTDRIAHPTADRPWLVFCSPPYAFYHERQADMLELVQSIQQHAPAGSILIVEADEPFDFSLLCASGDTAELAQWDVRAYAPAIVGLWRARADSS
jgi:16S rRNA (guanine966-N2)-methyltransferase